MCRGKNLHLQNDEFAISKDLAACLWMDYRTYYGESSLKEVLGGDFVIFNDDLYDEFVKFRGKVCFLPRMVPAVQ